MSAFWRRWWPAKQQQADPRPPHRPIPPQPEAERDWAVGDLAQCIASDGGWVFARSGEGSTGPKRGEVLRVIHLFTGEGTLWLVFPAFDRDAFPAGHFRKLRPCEAEFRRSMCAPVRETEPA